MNNQSKGKRYWSNVIAFSLVSHFQDSFLKVTWDTAKPCDNNTRRAPPCSVCRKSERLELTLWLGSSLIGSETLDSGVFVGRLALEDAQVVQRALQADMVYPQNKK